jgi:chromosome segregation ATPase
MAFVTSSPAPRDATDNLLSVLGNPEAATAKLKELQEATRMNEQSVDRLSKEAADLELRRNQISLEYAKLEGIKRETKKELNNAQAMNANLATRFKELEDSLADLEVAKKEVAAEKHKLAQERVEFNTFSSTAKIDLENRRKDMVAKERQVDMLTRDLNTREVAVKKLEEEGSLLVKQYSEKLVKLKALILE